MSGKQEDHWVFRGWPEEGGDWQRGLEERWVQEAKAAGRSSGLWSRETIGKKPWGGSGVLPGTWTRVREK